MAALAVGAVALGGWPFALFWAAAAVGVFWEWSAMVAGGAAAVRMVGIAALIAGTVMAGAGQIYAASLALAAGAAAVAAACPPGRRVWGAAGVAYAGVLLVAAIMLRRDPQFGLLAILFLFAVVWSTDILGYFVGRAIGGPRLAPGLSPKKTWSGACGGALGALAGGLVLVYIASGYMVGADGVSLPAARIGLLPAAVVAFILSIASQTGDLFESAVKRRFGVKDASHVIPGHGGLMDRLDGFIAAALVAALVGIIRGGLDAAAQGLLLWS